jgi:MoaA/NifB/PqqE/SkfB family radical SAM enzyme
LPSARTLRLLYRGPLESCNYGCVYCPFAKKIDSREDLAQDREALARFVAWISAWEGSPGFERIGVLVTPWGEGLIRRWYQDALVTLSRLPRIERVSIQTNLSGDLGWAERVDPARVGLWATFHPEWTERRRFVERVRRLRGLGIGISCGVVGFRRFAEAIETLRAELPEDVYLWINAAKREERYDAELVRRFAAIDPLFATNTKDHPSLGRACRTGESVVSVDGLGDVRRCHFVREIIGNLYDGSFDRCLRERPCPNPTCGCHIGYVHLDDLALHRTFGAGILERIPASPVWHHRALTVL